MIQPGTRLPSWQDLAAQLGVARGTVRPAYSALADHQLVTSSPTNGTRVVAKIRPHRQTREPDPPLSEGYGFYGGPAPFRMGVPARDLFPAKLFARLSARCARAEAVAPDRYPDPRGEDALRSEIAAHLAISRGVLCAPSQIFVTTGFLGGLGLLLCTLRLSGLDVWTEDPCFPVAREALRLSGLPPGASDTGIALAAAQAGMAPAPLSTWYAAPDARQAGLLLGVASARGPRLAVHCAHLRRLVDAQPSGGSTKPS